MSARIIEALPVHPLSDPNVLLHLRRSFSHPARAVPLELYSHPVHHGVIHVGPAEAGVVGKRQPVVAHLERELGKAESQARAVFRSDLGLVGEVGRPARNPRDVQPPVGPGLPNPLGLAVQIVVGAHRVLIHDGVTRREEELRLPDALLAVPRRPLHRHPRLPSAKIVVPLPHKEHALPKLALIGQLESHPHVDVVQDVLPSAHILSSEDLGKLHP
mmetsp:Transcript_46239/g.147983  ORF Transcript_46239/g.147983 Transcript_46239/m.147983 type:complete len:216 (-) Transcript_46239:497-1144(-)